jgi:parallel beta-helix repeat protein
LFLAACGGGEGAGTSETSSTSTAAESVMVASSDAGDDDATQETPPTPEPAEGAPAPESMTATTDELMTAMEEESPEPVVAAAAVRHIYVSASGSDSNPGTQARPFKTIVKASKVATPGTIVHVAPGTYPGSFTTAKSGTSAARIRYVSDVKWGAKIVPPANSGLVAGWYNTGSYVDIVGFEVNGTRTQGGKRWTLGIMIRGGNNTVQSNHVHHIATTSAACNSQGGSAINADNLQNGYNINFIGNVVHHIGVAGCNKVHGIYHSSSGTIKNNLIYQVGYGGIHLWHDASNIQISNNTIFGNYYGIIVGSGDYYKSTTRKVDNVHVSNNVVYDNVIGVIEMGAQGSRNTFTNNLVYKNSRTNWAVRKSHSGDVNADPQFVSYNRQGGGNYSLRSTSRAIGYGSPTYAPPTDINNVRRPQGGRIDIGAYEYAGAGAR